MTVDYGTDIAWFDGDLQPDQTASGPDLVRQQAMIRLSTRRGSCPGAPNDGIDLIEELANELTESERAMLPGRIRKELLKDDCIASCTVRAEFSGESVTLTIVGHLSTNEPFKWVFGGLPDTIEDLS